MNEDKVKQCREEMSSIEIEGDQMSADGLMILVNLVQKYGADVVAKAVEGGD